MLQSEAMICAYFDRNPDVVDEGCIVTNQHEDGVVFPSIETFGHATTFIGRTAILEAASALLGLTPAEIADLAGLKADNAALRADLTTASQRAARYGNLIEGLRAALGDLQVDAPAEKPKPAPKRRKAAPKPDAPADLT